MFRILLALCTCALLSVSTVLLSNTSLEDCVSERAADRILAYDKEKHTLTAHSLVLVDGTVVANPSFPESSNTVCILALHRAMKRESGRRLQDSGDAPSPSPSPPTASPVLAMVNCPHASRVDSNCPNAVKCYQSCKGTLIFGIYYFGGKCPPDNEVCTFVYDTPPSPPPPLPPPSPPSPPLPPPPLPPPPLSPPLSGYSYVGI